MRRFPLFILSVAIVCCLSQQAQAQSASCYTYSSVNYDEDSNNVTAYASTQLDYTATYYYSTEVDAFVTDSDGNLIGGMYVVSSNSSANESMQKPGTGAERYDILATHTLRVRYSGFYYVYYLGQYPGICCSGNYFIDRFFFSFFSTQDIGTPSYFNFQGRGPDTPVGQQNVRLGRTRGSDISTLVKFTNVKQEHATHPYLAFDYNAVGVTQTPSAELQLSGNSPPCQGTPFDVQVDLERHSSAIIAPYQSLDGTRITVAEDAQFRLVLGTIKERESPRPYFLAEIERFDANKPNRAFIFVVKGQTSGGTPFTHRAQLTIKCQ